MGYQQASKPTFYFIGVTTAKSSIMKVFPKWATFLQLGDVDIKGIDFVIHDKPAKYLEAVAFIKNDPMSLGALVTTHKMDLLAACRSQFEYLDEFAELMQEISCISKRNGTLQGHAKDPITSGLALETFLPEKYWSRTGAEIFIMGAGGSGLALTGYLNSLSDKENLPSKIIVTNRSAGRIDEMKAIHQKINFNLEIEYFVTGSDTSKNDNILHRLKPGSLVVNATGLGKDSPGSPITDHAIFPERAIAWDFNYRGDLKFLQLANAQKDSRNLQIEDGWIYFIHGWTRVIAEVFNIDIPTSGPVLENLSKIASETRN